MEKQAESVWGLSEQGEPECGNAGCTKTQENRKWDEGQKNSWRTKGVGRSK